jgi:hypothetical protein
MAESVKTRLVNSANYGQHIEDLYKLLNAAQADIEQLRSLLASHVHSGITTGASNSGAATTSIASASLNLQP